MLPAYFKLTFRHLLRNKLYSAINVIGLSVGTACMLMAIFYWKDEKSFDTFHQNNPNLYRITTTMADSKTGEMQTTGGTGQVQGPAFKAAVPEIQEYTRLLGGDVSGDVLAGNKAFRLQMLFADENFFKVFSFDLLRGNPQTALGNISSAVITESVARKFFNSIDVIGKQLQMDADPSAKRLGKPMQVTAVVKDLPANSSIQFEILMPMKFMQLSFADDNWLNSYLGTFVVLNPQADIKKVIEKFSKVYESHAGQQLAESKKLYGYDPKIHYGLQPITDIHLRALNNLTGNNTEGGVINGNSPVFSYLLFGIAVFILMMASINFINISIANSLKRAKEVGVRKIVGGSRLQIIMQFLNESAILCLVAFAFAIIITNSTLPVFNSLTGKHILFSTAFDAKLFCYIIILLVIIVLLTGLYPAYALSVFRPAEVLYNKQKLSGRNLFGKGLVVLQFSFAVFFGICTLVYYNQMHFIQTKDLGYNPHQVLRTQIAGDRNIFPIYHFLRNEMLKESSVKMIAFGGGEGVSPVKLQDHSVDAVHTVIDENYLAVLGIPLKLGRNLSPAVYPSDSSRSIIVNEAFVKAAGLQHPLGTQLKTDEYFDKESKTIVGVIKDYHSGSLRQPIRPMVMFMNKWYGGAVWVKLEQARLQDGMAAFERMYKKAVPGAVYSYQFMDELNAKQYTEEKRWQKIVGIAATLSILICCLGLFGLSHLATHRRIKEIGIRKVLGASVAQVVTIISERFLKLVMIAFILAAPVAWLAMNKWLQNFAYRISISWWIFAAAAVLAVLIAFVTISFQAIKAALANPVRSLRTE